MWSDNNTELFIHLSCSARCVVFDKPQTQQQRKKPLFSLSLFLLSVGLCFHFMPRDYVKQFTPLDYFYWETTTLSLFLFFVDVSHCSRLLLFPYICCSISGQFFLHFFHLMPSAVSLCFLSNPVNLIPLCLPLYKPETFQVQAVNLCQDRTMQILVQWNGTNYKSKWKWPLPSCVSYKHVDRITSHNNFNLGCICCRFSVSRRKLYSNTYYFLNVRCPSLCMT